MKPQTPAKAYIFFWIIKHWQLLEAWRWINFLTKSHCLRTPRISSSLGIKTPHQFSLKHLNFCFSIQRVKQLWKFRKIMNNFFASFSFFIGDFLKFSLISNCLNRVLYLGFGMKTSADSSFVQYSSYLSVKQDWINLTSSWLWSKQGRTYDVFRWIESK